MDTLGPQDPSQGGSPVAAPAPDTTAPAQPAAPQPAAPQKPSLWKAVVQGALNGLAGSAGAKSFGGGLAAGAAGDLNAQAAQRQEALQNQQATDQHTLAQARVASTYADIAHTQQIIHNMPPDWQTAQSEKLADQTAQMLGKGLLTPQAPAQDSWNQAQAQANQMIKQNPSRLFVVMPVRGDKGALRYQVMESPDSPTQSDVDVKLPDGSAYTIPKGTMSSRDAMALQVKSIQQSIANQSIKDNSKAPTTKVLEVPGKGLRVMAWNPQSQQFDKDMGAAPPISAQVYAQTKTTTVLGNDGRPQVFQYNPQTKQYDQPIGYSASGHMGTVTEQAAAVNDAGEKLIDAINANRNDFGNLAAWVKKYGLNTPVADPKLAGLQTALSTFAALQPALHGFRSHDAMREFQSIIGGVQNNPDAAIASIRQIQSTARSINPKLKPNTATVRVQAPPDPKTGKPGPIREMPADEARYYISKGAKVVK